MADCIDDMEAILDMVAPIADMLGIVGIPGIDGICGMVAAVAAGVLALLLVVLGGSVAGLRSGGVGIAAVHEGTVG